MKKKTIHNEQLGYHIPEGYFDQSKKDMLSFLGNQNPEVKTNISLKQFILGAGIIATVVFGVFTFTNETYQTESFEQLTIESLEVSDEEFDLWFDENFVLNDV